MKEKVEVQYKSDLYASYIQVHIPKEADCTQYAFQMLKENLIKGVLAAEERIEEGEAWFYLDITGKVNLRQEFQDREMQLEEMTEIFQGLIRIYEELRNYLIPDDFVLIEPDFIYRDGENGEYSVAVLPWQHGENCGLRKLAEFFLEKLNPRDENGITIAYLFYRRQSQPNFSLYQFMPAVEKENILKRQKKRENTVQQEKGFPAPSEDLQGSCLKEIPLPMKEVEKKKGFLSRLFRKKEKVNPEFDLSAVCEQTGFEEDLSVYSETVFFEEEKEEWKLQWRERGKIKTADLRPLPLTVGKLKEEAAVLLEDSSVSRIHCRFIERDGGIALMDMNSTNGTSLNGIKLKPGEIMGIVKNDEILIGKVRVHVV